MKLKNIINYTIENVLTKFTAILILFSVYLFYANSSLSKSVTIFIQNTLLTDSNISSIITISSVFIGFFATIMTMFASSQTESIQRLINTNKIKLFLVYSKKALLGSILVMIISICKNIFIQYRIYDLCSVCILFYFFMSSFRFTYICILMLEYSINDIEKKNKEEEIKKMEAIRLQKNSVN
jgi:hypothetical protein